VLLPVTVNVAVAEKPPDIAVMVVVPAATAVASPLEPVALLIDAMPVPLELHVAAAVRSCVVPSEYIPVAENCWVVLTEML
jgi:hypothetical protein